MHESPSTCASLFWCNRLGGWGSLIEQLAKSLFSPGIGALVSVTANADYTGLSHIIELETRPSAYCWEAVGLSEEADSIAIPSEQPRI